MIKQEELTKKLQDTLNLLCKTNIVLKDNIELNELITLKNTTAVINNFITYKLTLAFIKQLHTWEFVNDSQYKQIKASAEHTPVNANGFDVVYQGNIGIVAEVKGNVPCQGTRFGAAQSKSIIKDLFALKNGKPKSISNTENYYKFMVLIDDSNNIKNALEALIKSKHMEILNGEVCIVKNSTDISLDKINIVLIKI